MIVLDTNVVSEPIKPHGHPAVQAWLDAQVAETLYLTATSLSELLVGIQILPVGKRRDGLASALNELLAVLFANRILPFNREASVIYAAVGRSGAGEWPSNLGGGCADCSNCRSA